MTASFEGKNLAPTGVQEIRKESGMVRRKDSLHCTPVMVWETRTSTKDWVSSCKMTEEGSQESETLDCGTAQATVQMLGKQLPLRDLDAASAASPHGAVKSTSISGGRDKWSTPCFSTSTLDFQVRELFFYLNRYLLRSLLFSGAHPYPSFEQSLCCPFIHSFTHSFPDFYEASSIGQSYSDREMQI